MLPLIGFRAASKPYSIVDADYLLSGYQLTELIEIRDLSGLDKHSPQPAVFLGEATYFLSYGDGVTGAYRNEILPLAAAI
jgi:hypothetical protein